MPDDEKSRLEPEAPESESAEPGALDRRAYLQALRREMLKNLGLPENTKPEQVGRLLEIKSRLDQLKE